MAMVNFDEPVELRMNSGYTKGRKRLAAILAFDPRFKRADEIIDLVDLIDKFSDQFLMVYILGYSGKTPRQADAENLFAAKLNGKTWYYSATTLLEHVKKIEAKTTWQFSGEIDLILVNETPWSNKLESGVERHYVDAIKMNLHRMLHDGKITSYSAFFQDVIRFAEGYAGDNPTWDLSDDKLWKELKGSLFESFRKFIGFRKFQWRVEDYAVHDLRK